MLKPFFRKKAKRMTGNETFSTKFKILKRRSIKLKLRFRRLRSTIWFFVIFRLKENSVSAHHLSTIVCKSSHFILMCVFYIFSVGIWGHQTTTVRCRPNSQQVPDRCGRGWIRKHRYFILIIFVINTLYISFVFLHHFVWKMINCDFLREKKSALDS